MPRSWTASTASPSSRYSVISTGASRLAKIHVRPLQVELAGPDHGEVEHGLDHARQPLDLPAVAGKQILQFRSAERPLLGEQALGHLGAEVERGERGVQLMGGQSNELVAQHERTLHLVACLLRRLQRAPTLRPRDGRTASICGSTTHLARAHRPQP
jgi:hypothetical protein